MHYSFKQMNELTFDFHFSPSIFPFISFIFIFILVSFLVFLLVFLLKTPPLFSATYPPNKIYFSSFLCYLVLFLLSGTQQRIGAMGGPRTLQESCISICKYSLVFNFYFLSLFLDISYNLKNSFLRIFGDSSNNYSIK